MRLSRDEDIEVPLASLIDIVFLLIIFFVVTTNLQKDVIDRQINLAKSYFIPPLEEGLPMNTVTINLGYKPGQQTRYVIGGANYSLRQIEQMLSVVREKNGNDVPIVIRADRITPYREVQKLNDAIGRAGLYKVSHSSEYIQRKSE